MQQGLGVLNVYVGKVVMPLNHLDILNLDVIAKVARVEFLGLL